MTAQMLTAEDVAAMLGMTPAWVLSEARARRLPHYRFGRRVRFVESEIRSYLATRRVRADDPPVVGRMTAQEPACRQGSRGRVPAVPLSDEIPGALGPGEAA